MLRGLSIHDIVLIEDVEIGFRPGLNVLTGETGAGKSILLDALGFVLGRRGRASAVRDGAANGEVTAEFHLDAAHPALAVLQEAGLPGEDELILRRVLDSDGRSRAFVNDRRAGVELLRRIAETLVETHGQHDERGVLDPRSHRGLLDAFAELDGRQSEVREHWSHRRTAERSLEEARKALSSASEDAEYLRHAAEELTRFDPRTGEEAELDTARRTMRASSQIREDVEKAAAALGETGAETQLSNAARWLGDAVDVTEGRLEVPMPAIDRALDAVAEAQHGVARALAALDVDPLKLEATEERLFDLRALARKHRVPPDELPGLAEELGAKLRQIDLGEAGLHELEAALSRTDAAYRDAADRLSEGRRSAASRLDQAIMAELAPLKLERARFRTEVGQAEPGPEGVDEVQFSVSTNPGADLGPLNRIASGGELSRFLLAFKVCLAGRSGGLSLIFDEIDRGVGGATADAVGRRLSALAQGGQVLVVTHSPQVAARGDHHWRIEKQQAGGQSRTVVSPLDAGARVDEVARMLAGETVTTAARDAARALLAG